MLKSYIIEKHECGCSTQREFFCRYSLFLTVKLEDRDIAVEPCKHKKKGNVKEAGGISSKEITIADILDETLQEFELQYHPRFTDLMVHENIEPIEFNGSEGIKKYFVKRFFDALLKLAETNKMEKRALLEYEERKSDESKTVHTDT